MWTYYTGCEEDRDRGTWEVNEGRVDVPGQAGQHVALRACCKLHAQAAAFPFLGRMELMGFAADRP